MSKLSHIDEAGRAKMVDVSAKSPTAREARAEGLLKIKPSHRQVLNNLKKGDALTVAQIAGIQGGKRCSDLIPLCHPIALTDLGVNIKLTENGLKIEATAKTVAGTGVEMEAYTAVAVAGITLIDMLKGVDPDLELTQIRLMEKTGGKTNFKRD
ncbi:MAG TPA: cyclic pyranopterin monophosphate synthase MoaC [Fimbriimonadaceae bacterium]|jgi:cyclic pyranopterin phosphate synthase